jgi:hypothetical protein
LRRLLMIVCFVIDFDLKQRLHELRADGPLVRLVPPNLHALAAHALHSETNVKRVLSLNLYI